MQKPNTCPNCGSGLTNYSDHPTEGVCLNPDCIHHTEPIDYTMPLPDEAYMESKCPRCGKWQSECQCGHAEGTLHISLNDPVFHKGGFVDPKTPYIVGDGQPDGFRLPKDTWDKIRNLGASLLVVNHSQLDRDIDQAELELVAFGWIREDLQALKPWTVDAYDYLHELEKLLRRTKAGEIMPPKRKDS